MKPKRIENPALLEIVRQQPCMACGRHPDGYLFTHAHHVTTRGAGGDDVPENLMPLCAVHHSEWHQIGPSAMIEKYGGVLTWLQLANRHDVLQRSKERGRP